MKRFTLGIFTLFGFFASFVFSQGEESIKWEPKYRLTWEDFKGSPSTGRAAAITASGISYRFSSMTKGQRTELDFTVDAYFYPLNSWYRPELCDEVILGHEQLHFDISELFARKMRKELRETRFTENIKEEIKEIYRRINKELNEFQNRYDLETNFSRNLEKQLQWNKLVGKALGRE